MMSTLTIRVLSIVQRLIDWSSLTHSLTHTMIGDVHQSRTTVLYVTTSTYFA